MREHVGLSLRNVSGRPLRCLVDQIPFAACLQKFGRFFFCENLVCCPKVEVCCGPLIFIPSFHIYMHDLISNSVVLHKACASALHGNAFYRVALHVLRIQDSQLMIQDSGLRTQDSGLRTQGSGLRTQDSGFSMADDGEVCGACLHRLNSHTPDSSAACSRRQPLYAAKA